VTAYDSYRVVLIHLGVATSGPASYSHINAVSPDCTVSTSLKISSLFRPAQRNLDIIPLTIERITRGNWTSGRFRELSPNHPLLRTCEIQSVSVSAVVLLILLK
jgi:hypothetical protein